MIKKIKWFKLIGIVVITNLIGLFSSLLSGNIAETYKNFIKPMLSPPGWLFGVVWPVLYIFMGVSAYLIYQTIHSHNRKKAIILYWTQLFVNFLWSIIFFRFEWYFLSILIIILLDILVFISLIWFYKIKKESAYLMISYFIWILFATYLNIGITVLNM